MAHTTTSEFAPAEPRVAVFGSLTTVPEPPDTLPAIRPELVLWRYLCLLVILVVLPATVLNVMLPTPVSMESAEEWVVVVVSLITSLGWLGLLYYFVRLYRSSWRSEPRFAMVLAVLAIDAFRNVLEDAYFGTAYSGWIELIEHKIMRLLWQPQVMIISRLLNVATAMVIVWIVLERGFENLKLKEQRSLLLERRNRELNALQELARLVSGSLDLNTVLNRVCREIVEALFFQSAFLCLVDEEHQLLYGAAGYGTSEGWIEHFRQSLESKDILADIARTGKTEVIAGWDDRYDPLIYEQVRGLSEVRIFAPVQDAQGVVGVVAVTAAMAEKPDDRQISLLHSFLRHACAAIRNARLHETVLADRERLNLLTGSLEDKNQQLESFVYMVSHDLKAPLVSIQGFLTLFETECQADLNEDSRFYLERVRGNTEHLQELTRQLLELSRIGRVGGVREWTPLADLVQGVQEMLGPLMEEAGVTVITDSPLPRLYGDRTQLRQLLLNLVENAAKYMKSSGERTIRIQGRNLEERATPANSSSKSVEVIVADTGVGIPPGMHERVFQMFQRLPIPGKMVEGSGVGLAIVRKIAETHGGRAWVESDGNGSGAAFHVRLPIPDDADWKSHEAQAAAYGMNCPDAAPEAPQNAQPEAKEPAPGGADSLSESPAVRARPC